MVVLDVQKNQALLQTYTLKLQIKKRKMWAPAADQAKYIRLVDTFCVRLVFYYPSFTVIWQHYSSNG